MQKVLEHFFCDIQDDSRDTLKEWFLVKFHNTGKFSIKAKLLCVDGVERIYDYPFSAFSGFEAQWKFNLAEYLDFNKY